MFEWTGTFLSGSRLHYRKIKTFVGKLAQWAPSHPTRDYTQRFALLCALHKNIWVQLTNWVIDRVVLSVFSRGQTLASLFQIFLISASSFVRHVQDACTEMTESILMELISYILDVVFPTHWQIKLFFFKNRGGGVNSSPPIWRPCLLVSWPGCPSTLVTPLDRPSVGQSVPLYFYLSNRPSVWSTNLMIYM